MFPDYIGTIKLKNKVIAASLSSTASLKHNTEKQNETCENRDVKIHCEPAENLL